MSMWWVILILLFLQFLEVFLLHVFLFFSEIYSKIFWEPIRYGIVSLISFLVCLLFLINGPIPWDQSLTLLMIFSYASRQETSITVFCEVPLSSWPKQLHIPTAKHWHCYGSVRGRSGSPEEIEIL